MELSWAPRSPFCIGNFQGNINRSSRGAAWFQLLNYLNSICLCLVSAKFYAGKPCPIDPTGTAARTFRSVAIHFRILSISPCLEEYEKNNDLTKQSRPFNGENLCAIIYSAVAVIKYTLTGGLKTKSRGGGNRGSANICQS